MLFDLALAWDPARRRCDLVYDRATGRLAIDRTALTPMLASLGADRRAEPDDILPDAVTEGSIQAGNLNPARGWSGDAFGNGARSGSRLWLLERAKLTDETMADAEEYAAESLAWLAEREGGEVEVAANRVAANRNAMLLDVRAAGLRRQFQIRVGA